MHVTNNAVNVDLSVVILCYKSGPHIRNFVGHVVEILEDSVPSWEIVLVGNYNKHSNDPTPDAVREIAVTDSRIKAITLPKKGMMGWDARCGLKVAAGAYLCLIDGDEQMPPLDIIKVYRKIKTDNLDFVKTYRAKRYDGWARLINSYVYNVLFRMLFPRSGVRDVNSKPKIFTRAVYDKMELSSDDWFLDAEMIIKCRRMKCSVGEIATVFYKNPSRKSFVRVNTIFEFIKNLLCARVKEFFR